MKSSLSRSVGQLANRGLLMIETNWKMRKATLFEIHSSIVVVACQPPASVIM